LTRRNNADRLGAPHPDAPEIPDTLFEDQKPDPLSFITPTEFVPLPSEGLFYTPGHPLSGQDSVEIKFMTAKEEDLLTSRSLIEKGIVLDRLIDSLLVNRQTRSRDLLVCDRNAILIQARASGYGYDYKTTIACRNCGQQDSYEYDLNEALIKGPRTADELTELSVAVLEDGTFNVQVPNSPVDVQFRLLTGHDEKAMMDNAERRRKKKLPERNVTDMLNYMIVSVMGHEDRETIAKYVDSLPMRDSRFLRKAYESVSPSIELRKEFVCVNCDHTDDITFPFTTDFFWPNS
tara:strand:- start:251 stop:1123 length:873 start_codon:yes stop_codon:yes gene_type:complete